MSHTVTKLHFTTERPSWQDRLAGTWTALRAVRRYAATRQLLATLDDRMLSDIGISRAQAQFEAEAPIWDFHR